jgi:outer membrane protein OmpA-like peptidoglycan-associated protein
MKKITKLVLVLFLGFSALNINSQNERYLEKDSIQDMSRWVLRVGMNAVDDNGNESGSIFNNFLKLDEEAHGGFPIKVDLEYRLSRILGIELSGSLNTWKAGEGIIEEVPVTVDQDYFAVDAGLKVYYDNLLGLFKKSDWLDLYLRGGLGYFKQEEGGVTGNLGTGVQFWIADHFGLNLNATAKWALNDSNENDIYDTNHTQYSFGISYRFQDQDKDNDGIYDYDDYCPNIPGTREFNGCPAEEIAPVVLDSDKDGVIDSEDKCPTVYGPTSNNGCPYADSDGDTVIDPEDECPNVPGLVSKKGCPEVDSDGDGVLDTADKCPTVAGVASNYGCPVVQETVVVAAPIEYDRTEIERLSRAIRFNTNKSTFLEETYPILQSVISFVNRYPSSRFRIEGHTDSIGSYESNRALSQRRADAVKTYLLNNGVASYNIEQAIGYGERQPIESNMYKEGRRVNRRVEIKQVD